MLVRFASRQIKCKVAHTGAGSCNPETMMLGSQLGNLNGGDRWGLPDFLSGLGIWPLLKETYMHESLLSIGGFQTLGKSACEGSLPGFWLTKSKLSS